MKPHAAKSAGRLSSGTAGFPGRDTSSELDFLVRLVRQIYPKRSDDASQDNSIQLGTLLVVASDS